MEIKHFGHEHPMILDKVSPSSFIWCKACGVGIEEQDNPLGETSYYRCSFHWCETSDYLHKTCAEQLPSEIQHPLHPDHPLTLLVLPNNSTNQSCNCCGRENYNFFTYHCSLCQYNLDVLCALPIALNFDYTFHPQHPLIPLRTTASLFCIACGKEHRGIFYTCPTCITNYHTQFFIHQKCATLPKTLQHSPPGHDHSTDLILGYCIPPEYAQYYPRCEICSKRLKPKYWVYYCGGCRYFIHVNCAATTSSSSNKEKKNTSQTEPSDETDDRVQKSVPEAIHLPLHESVSLVNHLLKNMKIEATQGAKKVNFNHFSHDHTLTLFDVQSEDEELCIDSKLSLLNVEKEDKICGGCIQRISNSPFYSCAQCDVFLHKCCVELPTTLEKLCPCCQHQLNLVTKASTPFNLFVCKCCNMYCNGFAYHCDSCDFYLDVKCAFLPSAITHEGHHHHHLLQLKQRSDENFCNSCDDSFVDQFVFGCNICRFTLHVRCALLPCTVRQKYDELHLFTLCFSPIKDHPQEYICEVCERELDPKLWFYHCVECDISIHTGCTYIGEDYCNVKFGGIFRTDHHEHQLTLVHKAKKPSICNTCREEILCDFVFHADSTLECSQCNFKIHLECAL